MRARIGKRPIEAGELIIISNVANSLFLLAREANLPRSISAQLLGMHNALIEIRSAHGESTVKTKIQKDGTLDEWPEEPAERWEAIK